MRFGKPCRFTLPDFAAGAGDEIVDMVELRVLKVVLVSAEYRANAAGREQRQQLLHPIRVAMLRSRAERRMVTEREPPLDSRRVGERALDPGPVLRILEEPLSLEEALLRRVEADELDVAAVAEAIEQPRID